MISRYIDPGTGFTVFNAGAWLIVLLVSFFSTVLVFIKRIFYFFKKHKKFTFAILVLAGILAAILIGALMKNTGNAFDKKITGLPKRACRLAIQHAFAARQYLQVEIFQFAHIGEEVRADIIVPPSGKAEEQYLSLRRHGSFGVP